MPRHSTTWSWMMRRISGHLSKANPEIRHPFTVEYETVEKVGYIIVSTDRGLCGGLNANTIKLAQGLAALGVPVVCTEQNPDGLGPTTGECGKRKKHGQGYQVSYHHVLLVTNDSTHGPDGKRLQSGGSIPPIRVYR